jgi:tetratricopeptide (TPR) repeat protein
MFELEASDDAFLSKSIGLGEAVLVLGAGASASSRNRYQEPVRQSEALAELLATRAGFPYQRESLTTVLSGITEFLSDQKIVDIYIDQFKEIEPANDIQALSNFTWRRLYTWSIDDAINNSLRNRTQRPNYFNGMNDDVRDSDNLTSLQIVKLHGDVLHPEHGFIMSEAEYTAAIAGGRHQWYRRAAQDYINYTPIFVGSKLSEPILALELERAKRDKESTGRGYVVTPDDLSLLQKAAFRSRGLIHINATLADFIAWLNERFPKGLSPKDVILRTNEFSSKQVDDKFSNDDIAVASSIFPRKMDILRARAVSADKAELSHAARVFLRGAPPTWDLAASDIPVWLSPSNNLYLNLEAAIANRDRMFVAVGQAGSGKTTALLQALVKFGRAHPDVDIFELSGEVRQVRSAFSLLQRLTDKMIVVYMSDLSVFGDGLAEDVQSFPSGRITVVGTARNTEWNEHLQRRFGSVASTCDYSRFARPDYKPLIERLLQYVPAPAFRQLSAEAQFESLARSREQLLIALREATESQSFNDTITNEYETLPDDDCRLLLLIVAISTIARMGMTSGMAKEAYLTVSKRRTFESAEHALEGIILRLPNGRLFARHELYVRHIIEDVVALDDLLDCLIAISFTYTKFPVPIVQNVNRIDAAVFRFAWNHKFIFEQCRRRGNKHAGERVYSRFEIEFQLDGHFWLQYGLYLSACGRYDEALKMLRKSIEAYPNNPFAVHALAELQLQTACKRELFDATTRHLIDEAVESLLLLDSRISGDIDQYPIVTLATFHLEALVKHNQEELAKTCAKTYFERLKAIEKRVVSGRVSEAKERAFRYATIGELESRQPQFRSVRRRPSRR